MEDNIAIAYADFTDPAFIDTVRELPGFQESSNIIYFSNITDHITQRGYQMENIAVINNLRAYERAAKPAVFVDTLGYGLNYYLRARQSVPTFTHNDFKYRESWEGKKPEGLLFADVA